MGWNTKKSWNQDHSTGGTHSPSPSQSGWACSPREPGGSRREGHMPWGSCCRGAHRHRPVGISDRGAWEPALQPQRHPQCWSPPTTLLSSSHQHNGTADGRGTLMSAPALPLSSREWHSGDRSCRGSACPLCAPGGEARNTAAFRSTVGSTSDTVQTHSQRQFPYKKPQTYYSATHWRTRQKPLMSNLLKHWNQVLKNL